MDKKNKTYTYQAFVANNIDWSLWFITCITDIVRPINALFKHHVFTSSNIRLDKKEDINIQSATAFFFPFKRILSMFYTNSIKRLKENFNIQEVRIKKSLLGLIYAQEIPDVLFDL